MMFTSTAVVVCAVVFLAHSAAGANDFVTEGDDAFPSSFALDEATEFFWTNVAGYIYHLSAGSDDTGSSVDLLAVNCVVGGTGGDTVHGSCSTYDNNGSASLGGAYAANLAVGDGYIVTLEWSESSALTLGGDTLPITTVLSPSFSIVNSFPVTSSSVSTTSSISESSSSSPHESQSTASQVSTASSTSIGSTTSPESTSFSSVLSSETTFAITSSSDTPSSSSLPVGIPKARDGAAHKLSPGAKAGIAVGVIVFVLMIIVLVFLGLRLRKRRSIGPVAADDDHRDSQLPEHYTPTQVQAALAALAEKPELETSANKHELMGQQQEHHVPRDQSQQTPPVCNSQELPTTALPRYAHLQQQEAPFSNAANVIELDGSSVPILTRPLSQQGQQYLPNTDLMHSEPGQRNATETLPIEMPISSGSPAAREMDVGMIREAASTETKTLSMVKNEISQLEAEQARIDEAIRETTRLVQLRQDRDRIIQKLDKLRGQTES